MTFLEHLSELRKRLRNAALIFLVATIGVVLLRQEVLRLADPAGARGLDRGAADASRCSCSRARPSRSGSTRSWRCTARCWWRARSSSGSCGSSWRPASTSKEKRLALLVTLATAFCFIGGALFGYALISKPALTFLFGLSEAVTGPLPFKIEPTVMMDEMVGFMLSMLLGTGVGLRAAGRPGACSAGWAWSPRAGCGGSTSTR